MSSATAPHTTNGQPARQPTLLLVGWDGAVPDILQRLVRQGKLPNAARLVRQGSFRKLTSTIPPVTACAWSSFLSGDNPGKHGLFEFVTPRKNSYQFEYTNGGHRRNKGADFVSRLNAGGFRVGVVNVPMTFPPREIDGFVISGLDAPDEKSGIACPLEAFEQAKADAGGYRIDNRHLGSMKTDADRTAAIAEFKRIEVLRTDVTLGMIRRVPVDVLIIVYNATDQVQHHFWHLMDPNHPQYPGAGSPEVRAFSAAIDEIYEQCDVELGRLMSAFPAADVMLMSDHGAGPTCGPRIRLNNALSQAGLLRWSRGGVKAAVMSRVDALLRRTLSAKQKAMLARLLPSGRSAMESMALAPIDWAQTEAFAYEGFTLSPSIWINRRGLFPDGTVGPEDYERVAKKVEASLAALKDPRTGRPAIPKIYRAREIYPGPYSDLAPDFILDWWEGNTFTMTRSSRAMHREPPVFYPVGPAIAGQDITGIHRRDGILAAAGPRISLAPDGPASLLDLAPTTLALMGLPVPSDLDGRVLGDLLRDKNWKRSLETAAPTGQPEAEPVVSYSDREQEIIEERLSGLGYIE